MAVLLGIAIITAGADFDRHLAELEAWVDAAGPWGAAVFMLAFVLATMLLLPESALSVAAGVLFGLLGGLGVALSANAFAAILQYVLGRSLLRERVERVLATRPSMLAVRRALGSDELRLQVLLRLTPLNAASISYMLGAAGVGFGRYMLACIALIPHVALEVYVGYAGRHLVHVAGRATRAVYAEDLALVVGLFVAVIALSWAARTARRAVSASTQPPEAGDRRRQPRRN